MEGRLKLLILADIDSFKWQWDEVHNGFEGLTRYIERAKPKLLIHGHQHCNQETVVDGTKVIGVYGHRLVKIWQSLLHLRRKKFALLTRLPAGPCDTLLDVVPNWRRFEAKGVTLAVHFHSGPSRKG